MLKLVNNKRKSEDCEEYVSTITRISKWNSEYYYSVGDIVEDDGIFYKCTHSHFSNPRATPFDLFNMWDIVRVDYY